jgi:DNA-directed RNA polymerase specialized sigma24 family protein
MRIELAVEDFADVLPAEPGPDPLEARDRDRMIARLDPRAAALVRAVGVEGRTPAEAAAAHGLTDGAFRVALHRALKRLSELREGLG